MKQYIEEIIVPYVEGQRGLLGEDSSVKILRH